jgi:uncharacterized membrane protein YcaP (DUF421 family)
MTPIYPPSGDALAVEEDFPFQVRDWRLQRQGLFVLLLAILATTILRDGSAATLLRVTVIYAFLLILFRLAGKRALAQMTSFDLVLVMVIGDATQQALIGDDFTVGTALVAVTWLVLLDVGFGYAKARWSKLDRVVDGLPVVLVDKGTPLLERMAREGIDIGDIMTAGREQHGLRSLDEIDFAVLERSGGLSIIPGKRPE